MPKKNIVELNGRPLIHWSIAQAQRSGCIDYIHVSTDDSEIARVSTELGASCEFLRPSEIADDLRGTGPAVLHSLETLCRGGLEFDIIVELQPTYCLRGSEIIRQCVDALRSDPEVDSIVTCERIESTAHPDYAFSIDDRGYASFRRQPDNFSRQSLRPMYACHGLVLAAKVPAYLAKRTFYTNKCRLHVVEDKNRLLDINTKQDLELLRVFVRIHPEYLS